MFQWHFSAMLLVLLAADIDGQPTALFPPVNSSPARESSGTQNYGRLPLTFEPNRGQTDKDVLFVAAGVRYRVDLKARSAAVKLADGFQMELEVVGGQTPRSIRGVDQTGGLSSYFIGNDPSKWQTGLPNYRRIEYSDVYPGVDLTFYGTPDQLEYDITLAANADPRQIRLNFQGATSVESTDGGDLLIRNKDHTILQRKPYAYQIKGGRKVPVQAAYLAVGRSVRLRLSGFNRREPVVVDPILVYSTYVGETSPNPPPLDEAEAIAVDADGNAYLSGTHWQYNGSSHGVAFVSKLSPDGGTILYTAHVGGSNTDQCYAIAVDSNENAYITGYTTSTDFPIQNPFQNSLQGVQDAFVAKLSQAGTTLVYSTYLGAAASGTGIAVNANGNAYVTGGTSSSEFPVVTPFQSTYQGGGDAFVTEMSTDGASLVFSTFLGGGGAEVSGHIALDSNQNIYVTGSTASTNFPVSLALQATLSGSQDAYVTKLAGNGQTLAYSTYLGGTGVDSGSGIAVDSHGAAYITGSTNSANFPSQNPIQSTLGGLDDAFVTKISPDGSELIYSTYLGGTGLDQGNDIAVDSGGNANVAGRTYSDNFPSAYPLQGTNAGYSSGFASKISADGSMLVYSTYLGSTGDGNDEALGIAVDSAGAAYVGGYTNGTNFPTTPGSAQSPGFPTAGFVTKILDSPSPCSYSTVPTVLQFGSNASTGTVNVTTSSECSWIASSNQFWFSITSSDTGTGSGTISYSIAENEGVVPISAILSIGPQIINVTQGTSPCLYSIESAGQTFPLSGGTGTVNFSASVICGGWAVSNANSWFTVDPAFGAGNTTFSFVVSPNTSDTARSGIFYVGTEQFTITEAGVADFAGNGYTDIIWQDPVSGASAVYNLGGAKGTTILGTASIAGANTWHIVAVADFNLDGHPDLVWQDPVTGESQIWFMGGTQGTTILGTALLTFANSWRIVGAADFNLDGQPDLVWQDPVSGHAQIWYLGGPQGVTITGAADLTLANTWNIVGASDFNGDGQPDILWQDPVSGATQVWYLGGAQGNVVANAAELTGGDSWHIVAVADFNLDGHPDVAWQDPLSGESQVWFLGGAQGVTVLGTSSMGSSIPLNIVGPR
jgi:hypothetical protein